MNLSNTPSQRTRQFAAAHLIAVLALVGCSDDPTSSDATAANEATITAAAVTDATVVRGNVTDNYHGTVVADPYRWLEDDVRKSTDVASFVETQNARSSTYLAALPGRTAIEERMTRLWNYAKSSTPNKTGGRYWYSHNDGLANQSRIMAAAEAGTDGHVMLDPNRWSEDGTVALAGYWPDPSGKYVAYTVQDGGTDWRVARVRDLQTGKDIADELRWLKFTGLDWAADGSGFYYSRYPKPDDSLKFQSTNLNKAVYFHTLGDTQTNDELVFEDPTNPERGFFSRANE